MYVCSKGAVIILRNGTGSNAHMTAKYIAIKAADCSVVLAFPVSKGLYISFRPTSWSVNISADNAVTVSLSMHANFCLLLFRQMHACIDSTCYNPEFSTE